MIGRAVLTAVLSAALFPGAPAAAEQDDIPQTESELRYYCSTHPEGMRACMDAAAQASAVELAQAQDAMQTAIRGWSEDPPYRVAARNRLAASQARFVHYRTAQCSFAAAMGGGAIGNALDIRRLACEAELNSTRARQLHQFARDMPQMSGGESPETSPP